MTELILVRHGQDREDVRGGWSPYGLTPLGVRQVDALCARLRREQFRADTLLCSDLPRAAETGTRIAAVLGMPAVFAPEWRETNNGTMAGMPHDEAARRFPGVFWHTLAWDEAYEGGESPSRFFQRIAGAFADVTDRMERGEIGPRVLIATHGGPIRVVSCLVTGTEWTNRAPSPFLVTATGLHRFALRDGVWSVVSLDDAAHLGQEWGI